ncbi:poly(3-hydroxyalkanoate) granule-associated protein PhaF [Pseudomonas fragi]|uniref:Poly(3-hydroxyalkanoate) granule-associated protein PhaF n=1 Tax=Pseudomonas fragi TaxID=296 RepID=A0A266M027_PSEFR|nr:phasin family protein [Pseudomonas fragi]OZY43270.1 poly(3-hydroxyalkanoate) granule-associated protein PhaF [Pseudomonas fragi]
MAAKKPTAAAKESNTWVGKVEEYSRKIWLAGLGVYSKIDTDGSKLFDTLVKDGEKAEKLAKDAGHKVAEGVKSSTSSARSRVEDVKDLALEKWGELEEAFDKRLNSAITRLGVPSREEVKALHAKVETLTKHIEKLTAAAKVAASKAPVASKAVPAKAAAKPAVAKPAVKAVAKPAVKAAAKPAAKPLAKPAAAKAPVASKPAPAAKKPAAKKSAAAPKAPVVEATAPAPTASV